MTLNVSFPDALTVGRSRPRSGRSIMSIAKRLVTRPVLLIFLAAFACYLALGFWLTFRAQAQMTDAWSRVALANQVLTSRDPSFADIGFVWSPLPTLALVPLVALAHWLPSMVSLGFSSVVLSAICMAGAVVVFERIGSDFGVRTGIRALLVGLFMFNPVILLYGANGMSEACEIFALMLCARALMRWLDKMEMKDLVAAGMYAGLAYLTRYEPIASVASISALVALVTFCKASGAPGGRRHVIGAHVAVVSFPTAVAFLGWAGISWLIVGAPFEQFSSAYGNAEQVVSPLAMDKGSLGRVVEQLMIVAPVLPLLLVAAAALAWRRRDWRPVGAIAVLGPPVLFNVLSFLIGRSLGWLRFLIVAAPLAAILGAWLASQSRERNASNARRRQAHLSQFLVAGTIAILTVASTVIATPNIQDWHLAAEEYGLIWALQGKDARFNPLSQDTRLGEQKMAAWLDNLNLPEGSVLMDSFLGPPIQLKTDNPLQFVVNADLDFTAALADPVGFGIQYILVPGSGFLTRLDAVNRAYPEMYQGGTRFVELVKKYRGGSSRSVVDDLGIELEWSYDWKLYRVLSAQKADDFLGAAGVRGIVARDAKRR